jgi:hypothetical protein
MCLNYVKRILYLLAMFTGVRAAFNWGRSCFLPALHVAILDGETLQVDKYSSVKIRVNARPTPKALDSEAKAGMISLYLVSPGISSQLYAFMRLTSHFGYGHVEIAFYEIHGKVTVFAVRNILRSNIDCLRLNQTFGSLKFSSDDDEIILLREVLHKLNSLDIKTSFATPDECVSLAVTPSLLVPKQRNPAIEALRRKYRRIAKKLVADRTLPNAPTKHSVELTYYAEAKQKVSPWNPVVPVNFQ